MEVSVEKGLQNSGQPASSFDAILSLKALAKTVKLLLFFALLLNLVTICA